MSRRRGGAQRIPRPPDARPGGPPPWAERTGGSLEVGIGDVRRRLAELPPARPPRPAHPESRAAAVLVPLFEDAGQVRAILTRRPETMPSHRGEVAFPGGGFDPRVDASLRDTALREAREEIGLDPGAVEVAAALDGIATVGSRFTITPFVGLLASRPSLRPDPREVDRVFDVSLGELVADGVFREERWGEPGSGWTVHFYELDDETVWGATARILTGLLTHLATA